MTPFKKLQALLRSQHWTEIDPRNPIIVGEWVVYTVLNDENILTIGEGERERVISLLPWKPCQKKHNKAFIIAAAPVVSKKENKFWYLACRTKEEAKKNEESLHHKIFEKKFGRIYFHAFQGKKVTLSEVAKNLWGELKRNKRIDPGLRAQMDLVMHDGDVLSVVLNKSKWKKQAKELLEGYYK